MSKIGIFMGSFDPPHIGHISIISSVLNSKMVDKVLVVPAYKNPWKDTETPFETRVDMVKASTRIYDNLVEVSDIEGIIAHNGGLNSVSTFCTLDCLKKTYENDELYIITTFETLLEIPNWTRGSLILESNKFIAIRTKDPISLNDKDFIAEHANKILNINYIDISSTKIRTMVSSSKEMLYPWVTWPVSSIIKREKLYECI